MMNMTRADVTVLVSALAAGCSADRPHGGNKPDAGVVEMLSAPSLDPVPTSTPNGTLAIRGNTQGARIVVKGGPGDPVVRPVLPNGAFCADAPLADTGETSLLVFALKDGDISPGTRINVTKDAAAPIPSMALCLGQEQPDCVAEDTASSNCTDGKDNNCNGYTDECETGCNGCTEDAFGPNWSPFFVPMINAGTYKFQICPCHSDWFAFGVNQGEAIHVKVTFATTNPAFDLDLRLQKPQDAEENKTTSVAQSNGVTGTEEINWPATAAGQYYLHVYAYQQGQRGAYTLTVY